MAEEDVLELKLMAEEEVLELALELELASHSRDYSRKHLTFSAGI